MFLVCSDKHRYYIIILQLFNRIDINTPGIFSRKNSKLRNLKKNAQIKKKMPKQFISSWGEGNLIFCCMGSRENYFGSVGRQSNNNNPQFKVRHI